MSRVGQPDNTGRTVAGTKATAELSKVILTPTQGKLIFDVKPGFDPGQHDVVVASLVEVPSDVNISTQSVRLHFVPNHTTVVDFKVSAQAVKEPAQIDTSQQEEVARLCTLNGECTQWLAAAAKQKAASTHSTEDMAAFYNFFRNQRKQLLDEAAEINGSMNKHKNVPQAPSKTVISLRFKLFVEQANLSERLQVELVLSTANYSVQHEVRVKHVTGTGPEIAFKTFAVAVNPLPISWTGIPYDLIQEANFVSTDLEPARLPVAEAGLVDSRLKLSGLLILQPNQKPTITENVVIKSGFFTACGGDQNKEVILLVSLPVRPKFYSISPEVRPEFAFLVGELHNNTLFDIPCGNCSVFLDDELATVTRLPRVEADSSSLFDLGPSPDITVLFHKSAKREVQENTSSMLKYRYTIVTRTVVTNNLSAPVSMRLRHQLPGVADDRGAKQGALAVMLKAPTADGKQVVHNKDKSLLTWNATVNQGAEFEFKVEYNIDWEDTDMDRNTRTFNFAAPQQQQQQPQAQQTRGGFGLPSHYGNTNNSNNNNSSAFSFGSSSSTSSFAHATPAATTSSFGAPQTVPAFGFAAAPSSDSYASASLIPTSTPAFALFGSAPPPPQQPQQVAASSMMVAPSRPPTQPFSFSSTRDRSRSPDNSRDRSRDRSRSRSRSPNRSSSPVGGGWIEAADINEAFPTKRAVHTKARAPQPVQSQQKPQSLPQPQPQPQQFPHKQ